MDQNDLVGEGLCALPQPSEQVSTIAGTHKGRPYDNVTYNLHIVVDSRLHRNDGNLNIQIAFRIQRPERVVGEFPDMAIRVLEVA